MKAHQTFRLDENTIKEAKKIAAKENRSISNLYATAVIAYVLNKKLKSDGK